MNQPTNEERRERARHAVLQYKRVELKEAGDISEEDIIDLLTDLRHYTGKEMNRLIAMSENHYYAEFNEEASPEKCRYCGHIHVLGRPCEEDGCFCGTPDHWTTKDYQETIKKGGQA